MHPSNEKTVLIQLLDIYVHLPHCLCGNYASGLDSAASSLGNTNFINGGLWILPSRHTRQEGKRGLACSAKSRGAAANTTQQVCAVPNCFRCIEVHFPLNLSTSSFVVRICRNGPQSGSTTKYKACKQYLTSIKISSISDQIRKSIYGFCIFRCPNATAFWNLCVIPI